MDDKQLSLEEISLNLKLPLKRLQYLHYSRDDCPIPVARNGRTPAFSLNEITAYLRELGLIQRDPDNSRITLRDAADLLGISYTRIKELRAQDEKFPRPVGGTSYWKSLAKIEFDRKEMVAYKLQRKSKKGPQEKMNIIPIAVDPSGRVNADIRQFLAAPSARRPRIMSTGSAKTVRVRVQGDNGAWV